jgi:hypothetical protein
MSKSEAIKAAIKRRYPNGRNGHLAANWKGGRRIANQAGYIYVYAPDHPCATKDGYVMEHRLVAERAIDRFLTRKEVAHHRNGIKTDNRPENLEVMTITQHRKEHMEAHAKLHEARQENEKLKALLKASGISFN